jgi:trk system potassium uptake protein TrkA
MAAEYVVIGAGQFGTALALNLAAQGQAVLVIDKDERLVQSLSPHVNAAVVADTTDEATLVELDVARMTTAVVAIGAEATEASILTTALLRQLGVPRIVARAVNQLHGRVLRAVGAHEVLNPEEEIGKRLAASLVQPNIKEQLAIGNAVLAEMNVPERFVGKSLSELNIRSHFGVTVMAVRRGDAVRANPPAHEILSTGDVVIVLGEPDAVNKVASLA